MKLRARLERLEERIPPVRCPACHDRAGRIVIVTMRRLADGTLVAESCTPLPDPCPRCRTVPARVIEVVEPVVTSREEAEGELGGRVNE
jgi:hypothetical protein